MVSLKGIYWVLYIFKKIQLISITYSNIIEQIVEITRLNTYKTFKYLNYLFVNRKLLLFILIWQSPTSWLNSNKIKSANYVIYLVIVGIVQLIVIIFYILLFHIKRKQINKQTITKALDDEITNRLLLHNKLLEYHVYGVFEPFPYIFSYLFFFFFYSTPIIKTVVCLKSNNNNYKTINCVCDDYINFLFLFQFYSSNNKYIRNSTQSDKKLSFYNIS